MKLCFPFALLATLVAQVSSQSPVVVQHPDEHPFQPIYLRRYMITQGEVGNVKACDNQNPSCEWTVIVVIREEACIPENFVIPSLTDPDNAFSCPLLVEGYSAYPTEETSPDDLALKYHIRSIPGVDLTVYLLGQE